MSAYSLDTPSIATLKAEARALREETVGSPRPMTHSAALEEVAHRHGYRDWNTARAALPERIPLPVQMGQRVKGTYLSQPFVGIVIGMNILPDMQHYEITVRFTHPVNVSRSELMGPMYRRRVRATVDVHGVTAARTSDGEPHMRVGKI
jgi:hypothetical protein